MSNADKLLELARERFGKLSLAEQKVIRAAAEAGFADCRTPKDSDDDPANASNWGPDRVVRAEVIRWLCVDREARALVDPKGIGVQFAKVEGVLDLSCVQVPFPLVVTDCAITAEMSVYGARLPLLSLGGTHIRSITADSLTVSAGLFLRNGFTSLGEVRLLDATIGGTLDCAGGTFTSPANKTDPEAKALSADRINVKGNVYLSEKFTAEGQVRLLGSRIGGVLDCTGGKFTNPGGHALNADRADVKGDVFLSKGFTAEGEVRLLAATIGGNLDCEGADLTNPVTKTNPEAKALNADGTTVKGNVFLRENFTAVGEVLLLGATIGGDLICTGGKFSSPASETNPKAMALIADGINVKGSVFLTQAFAAEGLVCLPVATIGGNLECTNGKFANPEGDALNADGADVKGSVLLREKFTADSNVRFLGARIGGDMDCHGATFTAEGDGLSLGGAEIAKRLILRDGTTISGQLSLAHATVGLLCDDQDSWPPKGKLHIHGFEYASILTGSPATAKHRLAWVRLQPTKPFRTQPYVQLARVLRDSGKARDAREVLIAKEIDQRRYGDLGRLGKAWNWFLEKSIGYGYRTHLVLVGAMLFLALGANLFWAGKAAGLMVCVKGAPSTVGRQPASNRPTQEPLRPPPGQSLYPLVYSLDALVPVVNLHQEEYWLPNPATRWGCALRVYLWLHICVGWILTTLAILGLTGIVRR